MGDNPKPGETPVPGKYAWFLVTADWGNLYATLTEEFLREGRIQVTAVNQGFFHDLFEGSSQKPDLRPGISLRSNDRAYAQIIRSMAARADAYLRMVNSAIQPDGTTAEGFDPVTKAP